MKSRVRNHSRVGHGQRTGGAEERGRLAGRCMGSVSTLALFHDQTEACRDLYLNYQVWHRSNILTAWNIICRYAWRLGLSLFTIATLLCGG